MPSPAQSVGHYAHLTHRAAIDECATKYRCPLFLLFLASVRAAAACACPATPGEFP